MKKITTAAICVATLALSCSSAFAAQPQEKDRQGECNLQIAYTGNGASGYSAFAKNGYKLVLEQSDAKDPSYQLSNSEQRFQPLTIDVGGNMNLRFLVNVVAYNFENRRVLSISASEEKVSANGDVQLISASSQSFTSKKDKQVEAMGISIKASDGMIQLDNPAAVKLAHGTPVLEAFSGPQSGLPPGLLYLTAQIGCGTHIEPDLSAIK